MADYICEQILLGKWPPNERIPSVRDFGGMMEVNPNTVMRTYEFLQNKGIIFNKRGIGYSVSDDAQQRILTYKKERFLESDLPEVFKTLYLLNISMDQVKMLYEQFVVDTFPLNN